MKTIILIRHAKSSWNDMSLDDFERPLNKRGKRDLPIMAKHLKTQNIKIDKIYSSAAKRAKITGQKFAKELDIPLKLYRELYMVDEDELMKFINKKLNKHDSIAIVGHNPEITDLYNQVSDTYIDNIPTSGYVILKCEDIKISKQNCKLIEFAYPKREDISPL